MRLIKLYIKLLITEVLHPITSERLLARWVKVAVFVSGIIPSKMFFLGCLRLGMRLHKIFNCYLVAWLMYYLKRDTNWAVTNDRMYDNCLCPDGARQLYREILFDSSPEDVEAVFKVLPWSDKVRNLYRQRQVRCGFRS